MTYKISKNYFMTYNYAPNNFMTYQFPPGPGYQYFMTTPLDNDDIAFEEELKSECLVSSLTISFSKA